MTQPKPTMEDVEELLAGVRRLIDKQRPWFDEDLRDWRSMQAIDFLLARVRELENGRLVWPDQYERLRTQLAAAQEDSRRLRDRLTQIHDAFVNDDIRSASLLADDWRETDAAREASEEPNAD